MKNPMIKYVLLRERLVDYNFLQMAKLLLLILLLLNNSKFRDAVELRYDWDVPDMPSVCVCGDHFNVDHAMICKKGRFCDPTP